MKTLYRKGTVHPSPPPSQPPPPFSDHLSFLPAAILTLAAALSPEDREVLAYLLSCSSATNHQSPGKKKGAKSAGAGGDHSPAFTCDCFRCYMSFWVRWDSSPNRQLIHEIIDAFEDWILAKNKKAGAGNRGGRRERKKKGVNGRELPEIDRVSEMGFAQVQMGIPEPDEDVAGERAGESDESGGASDGEKGPVKKLVSLIGERIWSVWG